MNRPHWLRGALAKVAAPKQPKPAAKKPYKGPPPDNRPNIYKTALKRR